MKPHWFFYVGRFTFWLLYKIVWRFSSYGSENIPLEGGVIIAPNHASWADPPLAAAGMKRPLHFMAKQELFDMPIVGLVISHANSFPVRRGQRDVSAFRTAHRLLGQGRAVLLFPEGGRTRDGNFRPVLPGVGMLACHAQAPIVPARVLNSFHLASLKKLKIIYGKPIYPPKDFTRDTYKLLSEQVMEEIKKLHD